MVAIKLIGIERTQKMLINLPKNTLKEIDKTEGAFIKFVQKSAKLRAPRFSGQLASSIEGFNLKKGNWALIVESPYGWFQEHGFTGKFLPYEMPVRGGYLIGNWMEAKGIAGPGIIPSGIPHPFVAPAFEMGLNRLPFMLQNAMYKAAEESR